MKFLVTGGQGYLGKHLINEFFHRGLHVLELKRNDANGRYSLLDYKASKLGDTEFIWEGRLTQLSDFLKHQKITHLVNMAASVRKDHTPDAIIELLESNATLTSLLAQMCSDAEISEFITLSTYSMFSDFDLYSPQTFYAASKKASEDLLSFFSQANNLSITILYLYDVYGPKQPHKRFLNLFINAIKSGEDFHMSQGAQEVNFIHMKDVIDGILYSILNKLPKNFENIAKYSLHSNETFKLAELPSLITAALEFENLPIAVIKDLPYREREIFSFKPKYPLPPGWNSKIQFRDGIRDLI